MKINVVFAEQELQIPILFAEEKIKIDFKDLNSEFILKFEELQTTHSSDNELWAWLNRQALYINRADDFELKDGELKIKINE